MYLAYDALSDGMKHMLDGMTAVHSARRPYGPRSDWFPTQRAMDIRRSNSAQAEVEHPVIRTHPETGRKGLFVNSTFTIRFSGMSEERAHLCSTISIATWCGPNSPAASAGAATQSPFGTTHCEPSC
jgi:alpha-ketoglutarate-dependent taurine dioxygenase